MNLIITHYKSSKFCNNKYVQIRIENDSPELQQFFINQSNYMLVSPHFFREMTYTRLHYKYLAFFPGKSNRLTKCITNNELLERSQIDVLSPKYKNSFGFHFYKNIYRVLQLLEKFLSNCICICILFNII